MKIQLIFILALFCIQGCSSSTNIKTKNYIGKKYISNYKPMSRKGVLSTNNNHIKRVSCKYFATQAHAQKYYNAKKRGWKSLDRDKDKEPCECLKGGSKEHESTCKYWRKKNQIN